MELPYSEHIWFTPRYAFLYFWEILRKDEQKALKSVKYKKEREAWILGNALFGISKKFGTQWWLQVPVDDPPDMLAMTLVPEEGEDRNIIMYRKIEIMMITNHTKDTIVEEIKRKMKNKFYEKETGLIVYLNRTVNIEDMRALATQLSSTHITASDVWILACTSEDERKYILFSIKPSVESVQYDIIDEMKKIPPGDSIEVARGKGTGMEFIPKVVRTKFIP